MASKEKTGKAPAPNPDPQRYILVHSKEGDYYRLRRGQVKEAALNAAYQKSSESMKLSAPAATRLAGKLEPWVRGLRVGRLKAKLSGGLRRALNQSGRLHFAALQGLELQAEWPLQNLLLYGWTIDVQPGGVTVKVPIGKGALKRHSKAVTGVYLEAVVVWGDAGKENGLRVESETSRLYGFEEEEDEVCTLRLPLPQGDEPWLVVLKVNSTLR